MPADGDPLRYRPQDAATGWAYTLTDPLIAPRRQAAFEDAMAQVCLHHRDWALTYLAGTVAALIASLPPSDPWRHLSVRLQDGTVIGDPAPGQSTVNRQDTGQPFGTWRDGTDLVVPVYVEPESDPSLAALADPLPSAAATLIAAAGSGDWRAARRVLDAVSEDFDEDAAVARTRFSTPLRGYALRDIGRAALVWALYRRRAYLGPDDPYPLEVLLSWTSNAARILAIESDPANAADAGPGGQAALRALDTELRRDLARDGIPDSVRQEAGQQVREATRPGTGEHPVPAWDETF